MLDQFINSLPKTVLAILVLVGGLIFLRYAQPPVTMCDAQMELFRESEKQFLYPPPGVGGIQASSKVKHEAGRCRDDNSPGGCFELFTGLKKMTIDLGNVSEQCAEAAGTDPQVSAWLKGGMELMVLTAWGPKPPNSYIQRNNWFDTAELSLYCSLRHQYERMYGKENYDQWQEAMMQKLPGVGTRTRNDVWPLTIFSNSCAALR